MPEIISSAKLESKSLPFASRFLTYAHTALLLTGRDVDENGTLNFLTKRGREFQVPYSRWELVRKIRAHEIVGTPKIGFKNARTGMEGYFVGSDLAPEAVTLKTANMSLDLRDQIVRDHKYDPRATQQIFKTLHGDDFTPDALRELDVYFQLFLARMRALPLVYSKIGYQKYLQFRQDTELAASSLPKIEYHWNSSKKVIVAEKPMLDLHDTTDSYELAGFMNSRELEGAELAADLGRIGITPLRTALMTGLFKSF